MPINQWLPPYTMETSAKTSSSNPTATFWASSASPAAVSVFGFNLNNEDEEELLEEPAAMDDGDPKQPLFEKPLTPSDVGKLNRLVIPKQHAEKYFPLNGGVSVEKGLLLGFEDEVGKSWRFRYSYWNSSQSYVLTKGWSRFVKEKRLDAGDIVVFARHPKEVGRLFIGWRRRRGAGGQDGGVTQPPVHGGGWSDVFYSGQPYPSHHQTDCLHAENHIRGRNRNSKILRLFGVNLECEGDDPESSTTKTSSRTHQLHDDPYRGHYLSNNRTAGHTDIEVWGGHEDGQG